MDENIDLLEYWRVIRKRWLVIVAIVLISVGTSAILSFYFIHPVYQASALVIVGRKSDNLADNLANLNSVTTNRELATTYEAIAKSKTVLNRVAETVGDGATNSSLVNQISVQAVKDTEIISISVTDAKPSRAALIANTLTTVFSERVMEVEKVDNVGLVDPADIPQTPISPNKKKNILIAFGLGLVASIGFALLLEFLDNTVKSPDEVEEFGLQVLGSIPQLTASNQVSADRRIEVEQYCPPNGITGQNA